MRSCARRPLLDLWLQCSLHLRLDICGLRGLVQSIGWSVTWGSWASEGWTGLGYIYWSELPWVCFGTAPANIPQWNLDLRVSIMENTFVALATETSTLMPYFEVAVAWKWRVNTDLVTGLIFLANGFYWKDFIVPSKVLAASTAWTMAEACAWVRSGAPIVAVSM